METRTDITQANVDKLITIYGGSGFLGRHVVRALCKRGYRIRVACGGRNSPAAATPLGRVGQTTRRRTCVPPVEAGARADVLITWSASCPERSRQRFDRRRSAPNRWRGRWMA
jgi:NADH dehydrogenase